MKIGKQKTTPHLDRGLHWLDAIALVIGTIIGTGIFLKTTVMANLVGSAPWVMLAWVIAGLLSLTGALTYAELGSLYPNAGGEYVYLREAYGSFWAFLYGWMRFWIASPGSIAAYGVGAASFLGSTMSFERIPGGQVSVAFLFILGLTLLNCLTVSFGGKVQSFFTGLKLFLIFFLVLGIFAFGNSSGHLSQAFSRGFEPTSAALGVSGWGFYKNFGLALIAALWAFDGWNNLPMVAGEIENPQRNIPLALGLGIILVFAIYGITNVSYFHALSWSEIIGASSDQNPQALPVAALAAKSFLGDWGIKALSFAMVISALGAMNGAILTGARVPFAMATDGLFFGALARISPRTHVPVVSLVVQGLWSCVLAAAGTFDQLTDQVVFASWIFYAATTGSIFVFRKRGTRHSDYRLWGYPWVPLIFICVSILLLANTLMSSFDTSLKGLGIIILGVPVYYWMVKKKNKTGLT